ncbi:MAG: hypothetical protein H6577_17595 [Lewinellaceae bacterium]|nr:hypothetical protein [Lewinellaceae bacterium]
MDANERIGLADGSEGCYLNVTDTKSNAILKAKAFPLRRICMADIQQVRQTMLDLFRQWGCRKPSGVTTASPSACQQGMSSPSCPFGWRRGASGTSSTAPSGPLTTQTWRTTRARPPAGQMHTDVPM